MKKQKPALRLRLNHQNERYIRECIDELIAKYNSHNKGEGPGFILWRDHPFSSRFECECTFELEKSEQGDYFLLLYSSRSNSKGFNFSKNYMLQEYSGLELAIGTAKAANI